MKPIITGMLLLLFGVTVPAFAQEEHHEEGAKPAQHEEQAKPAAKQGQAKPQKHEQQAKPAKQEQAKPEKQQQQAKPQKQEQQAKSREQNQQKQAQQQAKGQQQQEKKQQQQQTKTQQNQQHQQQQATAMRKNHKPSTREMVRKIGTDTNTTKVILVRTIMPALRQVVGANTMDAGSTLTAAIGSMQQHIRRGFTSRTCTSLWERMGCGMQLHTVTLL